MHTSNPSKSGWRIFWVMHAPKALYSLSLFSTLCLHFKSGNAHVQPLIERLSNPAEPCHAHIEPFQKWLAHFLGNALSLHSPLPFSVLHSLFTLQNLVMLMYNHS